jgi:hypothetical protein
MLRIKVVSWLLLGSSVVCISASILDTFVSNASAIQIAYKIILRTPTFPSLVSNQPIVTYVRVANI